MDRQHRVLLLGANGGAGRAVAARLKARGDVVIASCRTKQQSQSLLEEGLADHCLVMSLDDQASIETAINRLSESAEVSLTGLVNCAAVTWPKPLELSSIDEVRDCFEANVFGPLRVIQLVLPMLRKGNGRIVQVSSTSGSLGVPLLGAYSASKHALEGLMDVLRRELAEWRVPVSLVIPGGIKTPMIGQQYEAIDAAVAKLATPLERAYKNQYFKHRRLIELADGTAVTADKVANYVLRALDATKPKARYYTGLAVRGGSSLTTSLPDGLLDQVFELLPASTHANSQK